MAKLVRKYEFVTLEERSCRKCEVVFQPIRSDQFYCSQECRHIDFAKKKRAKKTDEDKAKDREYMREYYAKNKEKLDEQNLRRYYEQQEKRSEQRKARYQKDPEKHRAYTRKYYAEHREERRAADNEYKDKVRHGGMRKILIEESIRKQAEESKGKVCSNCGVVVESGIHAHHLVHKQDHDNQALLCASCHASFHHKGVDKKVGVTEDIVQKAIQTSKNLFEVSDKVGLSRAGLYLRRKRYGIKKECRHCKEEFMPDKKFLHYCSEECQTIGIEEKRQERIARVDPDRKKEIARVYYLKHREKRLAKVKERYALKSEEIKAYAREYHRKKKQ